MSKVIKSRKVKKKDKVDILYKAVAGFVESIGGKVIVAGGVTIQEWPGDMPYTFTVGIKCTGKRPIKPESRPECEGGSC